MEFSLNSSNENFFLNEAHQSLPNDDSSYISKNHLNLGQSSFNRWSLSPDLTDISNRHNQNLMPLIPFQNQDPLNQNWVTTQNHLVDNSLSYNIPSNYPYMSIETYSSVDNFTESMHSITSNNKIYKIYNTPISETPKGIFDNFCDLQGHTLWDEIVHNKECTKNVDEAPLDQMIGEFQSFDMPVLEGIKNPTEEIMNQLEDQQMKTTYPKKNKKVVRTSKLLKEGNIIKAKWTKSEDL